MTHQPGILGKNWKLFPATLQYHRFSLQNRRISGASACAKRENERKAPSHGCSCIALVLLIRLFCRLSQIFIFYPHNFPRHFGNHLGEGILHSNILQKLHLDIGIKNLELEVIQPRLKTF